MRDTALSRNAVDSTLSVMEKRGLVLRVAQGLYRKAPPAPKPEPPPTPAEQPRADGISVAQWVAWLHAWDRGETWAGPGVPPDRETGIMVDGGGCRVSLDAWAAFLGERDALAKLRAADAAIRDRLTAAAHGNVAHNAKLDDLRAVHTMIAAGITLDQLEFVVRAKHDRRSYPKNPPLQSWADLLKPVAEHHARFVLARKLVDRWQARLADLAAKTDDSPTLRRAMSEIVSGNAVDARRGLGQHHTTAARGRDDRGRLALHPGRLCHQQSAVGAEAGFSPRRTRLPRSSSASAGVQIQAGRLSMKAPVSPAEAKAILDALPGRKSLAALTRELVRLGRPVSLTTIRKWRSHNWQSKRSAKPLQAGLLREAPKAAELAALPADVARDLEARLTVMSDGDLAVSVTRRLLIGAALLLELAKAMAPELMRSDPRGLAALYLAAARMTEGAHASMTALPSER